MKAVLCPVCGGSGRLDAPNYGVPVTTSGTPIDTRPVCHGCDGRGWVAVPD